MISAPADVAWEPPAVIDEFRLLRPLGRGAMGQVYAGHDTLLDREVAVKFIAALRPDERARQRFLTEARAIARLQHPNVVSIYRVGEFDGRPYLVSELVRGEPLSAVPRPVPWQQVLDIALDAARGLAAAHRQGVLHRAVPSCAAWRAAATTARRAWRCPAISSCCSRYWKPVATGSEVVSRR
jgi:serine/threonine protein kinase